MAQKGSGSTPHGRPGEEPGGPRRERPEVYRRRRVVAALAAAVLLALVAVGIVSAVAAMLGPGEPGPAPEPVPTTASAAPTAQEPFADFTPRPRDSVSASPSASPTAQPVEECGSALAVRASTDQESYPAGVAPVLVLTLENTGTDPCHVNAGTSQMAYVVGSGADSVFDSRHCQAGADDREVTLEPDEELSARLTWNRTRSVEGCAEEGGQAQPGYYRLTVSLGERTSEPVPFVLE